MKKGTFAPKHQIRSTRLTSRGENYHRRVDNLDRLTAEVFTEEWEQLAKDAEALMKQKALKLQMPELTSFVLERLKADMEDHLTHERRVVDKWLAEHGDLMRPWTRRRLEWVEMFHYLLGECDDRFPEKVAKLPWWGWYAAIRGNPFPNFPSELSWRVALHRLYLSKGKDMHQLTG